MEYQARVVDAELGYLLRIAPAVSIQGTRACGKTTTAKQRAGSVLSLDPSEPEVIELARLRPPRALEGDVPRLLDEWQLVPQLWDAVRREVDERQHRGQFILSGSAWPTDDERRHSGAGRIVELRMRTMSLFESGDSSGEVSLERLANGSQEESGETHRSIEWYCDRIVRGGWPGWIDLPGNDARHLVDGYLEALSRHDFPGVAGRRRAPQRMLDFLRGYATLTAHPAPLTTVAKRLSGEGIDVGKDYPGLFHDFASRLFVVEDQPAWSPSRRSRTRLVATAKRHLVDPSLAAALMGFDPAGLAVDLESFGFLFESLVVRDLRVYAQPNGGTVLHYRTADAVSEIDAVVEYRDGSWIGVEVKSGYGAVEAAAEKLVAVAGTITREPSALVVVVPSGRVIRLDNGVWVVPAAVLGP